MNHQLKELLDNVIGTVGVPISNGEIKYYCPFRQHQHPKFQIDINENSETFGRYNCWVCKAKGNFYTLFRHCKATKAQYEQLKHILTRLNKKSISTSYFDAKDNKTDEVQLTLPDDYKSLLKKTQDPEYKNAYYYIKKNRKLTNIDIIRHNIGYCSDGEYNGKLIIPSYDLNGNLNYFVGRSYYDVKFGKHKNPSWSKNFIGNEIYINWDEPLIIVEGSIDAITAKRNVIPLYGKIIPPELKKRIVEKKVKKIYVALDRDALKELIPMAQEFMDNGIETYVVKLPDKDPNDMGYQNFMKLIYETKPLTLKGLIELKLGIGK